MRIQIFDNNDSAYFEWLDKNTSSFAVNTLRGINSNYFVLHKSKCHHISTTSRHDKGAYTERDYIKICSDDINELKKWFEHHNTQFNGEFKECKTCVPNSGVKKSPNK